MNFKKTILLLGLMSVSLGTVAQQREIFSNPVINADVPDPSMIRVGDYYYLVSTTMHLMPGCPVMRSKDLVHWETISYVFQKLTDLPRYDLKEGTVYGRGQWASSIRYHKGQFYVWFSPNDEPHRGYIYTTKDPAGEWKLVRPTIMMLPCFLTMTGKFICFTEPGSCVSLRATSVMWNREV